MLGLRGRGKGTGKGCATGSRARSEVGWWGSWSEGSHPQGLSPEEEGLLGSFLEPLQDAPRTPSPRIPSPRTSSPRSPVLASFSPSREPAHLSAPKWGFWFFRNLPPHKRITAICSPEPLETASTVLPAAWERGCSECGKRGVLAGSRSLGRLVAVVWSPQPAYPWMVWEGQLLHSPATCPPTDSQT